MVKVMAAPQKVGTGLEPSIRSIKRSRARVVGLTEMDLGREDFVAFAKKILGRGWRTISRDRGEHSREIPFLVHLVFWIKVLEHRTIKLSEDLPGRGAGNDRWLNVLRLKIWGKVWVFMNTHTNAQVQRVARFPHTLLHGPRLVAYQQEMRKIDDELTKAEADHEVGRRIVVMGDFNMLDLGEGQTWEWSPHQVFQRHGMHWVSERVVYIAWGRGVRARRRTEVTPPNTTKNPADHARIAKWLRSAR